MIQEKYFSTSDLCKRYHRSSRTLARWPATKKFPKPAMATVGAENLYLREDVEKWEAINTPSQFQEQG